MEIYKKKVLKKLGWTGLGIAVVALIIAISSCSKEELLEPSLETVLENYDDETLLDEVIALSDEESDIDASMKNINKLEERLRIVEQLDKLNLEQGDKLSDELKEKYSNLTEDEIKTLIGILKGKDAKPVELERIEAGLAYVEEEYKNWVRETGTEIAEDLLKKAIKQGACDISGLEPEYYNEWKIGVVRNNDFSNSVSCREPQTWKNVYYELKGTYLLASNTLCNIQGLDENNDYKTVNKHCIEAINYAKIISASGAELKETWLDGDVLNPEISEKKAKEKVKSLTK